MSSVVYDFSLVTKTAIRDYVFKDISPVDSDIRQLNGDVPASIDGAAIQNGVNNMFLFARGERVLLPDFGNNLYKYVYEGVTNLVGNKIVFEIRQMFKKWEPRVEIIDLQVVPLPEEHAFNVTMVYTIPSLDKNNIINFTAAINQRR